MSFLPVLEVLQVSHYTFIFFMNIGGIYFSGNTYDLQNQKQGACESLQVNKQVNI